MEIWREIPGFEGRYEVSSKGKVKSIARRSTYHNSDRQFRFIKERIFPLKINKDGYPQVALRKNGKLYLRRVHRLVLLAFVGPSDLIINHKNSIKTDNRLENLEYCTVAYNFEHALLNGACFTNHGENQHVSKLSNKDRVFIIENKGVLSAVELAEILGVSKRLIFSYWSKPERYKKMLLQDFKSSQ